MNIGKKNMSTISYRLKKKLNYDCFSIEGMDDLRFYVLFNSISVISGRWKGEDERFCAIKLLLGSERISPPSGFEPKTPWSEAGSANRSATRSRQIYQRVNI